MLVMAVGERPDNSQSSLPPHFWERADAHFQKERLKEQERVATFGEIRPVIHIPDYNGYRLVAVRNRLYYSKKWKFVTDFLFEYGMSRFGKEWLEVQTGGAVFDQHPLYILRKRAYAYYAAAETAARRDFRRSAERLDGCLQ
jgi:hypothetical protein